ncbi:MAG: hypothetical protein AAF399_20120 [Bacteroidota bacterium]
MGGTLDGTHSLVMLGYVAVATAPAPKLLSSIYYRNAHPSGLRLSMDKDLEGAPVLSLLKYAKPTLQKTKRGAIRSLVETDDLQKVSRRIATAIYWGMLFLVTSDVPPAFVKICLVFHFFLFLA